MIRLALACLIVLALAAGSTPHIRCGAFAINGIYAVWCRWD